MSSTQDDEQDAIALTEITWEKSMRNEDNPRTHEEVVKTASSLTVHRTNNMSVRQQSNPLFNSATLEAETSHGPYEDAGENSNGSPPKLNPIFSEATPANGKRSITFNSLADEEEGGGDGSGDGSGDPSAGSPASAPFSMRTKCREFVYSIQVQTFILLLLAFDVALLITEAFVDRGDTKAGEDEKLRIHRAVDICTALIVIILTFEISLRILADTPKQFFSKKVNWFDFIITIGSVALVIADLDYTGALLAGRTIRVASHLRVIQKARLAAHSLRVITRSLGVSASAKIAARNKVGTNKKRYQKEGFDLDLCYITKHVIAMSVPAVDNIVKLYRNPIKEVERFFRLKHTELRKDGSGLVGMYQIHNLCPELPYADSHFHMSGGEILRYNVQDHTPPSLNQLIDFCHSAQDFFQRKQLEAAALTASPPVGGMNPPKAVLAIHCRGGKGRTGSVIAAWLLYSKQQPTSKGAMSYFAKKRTDLKKKGKLQGIETPSQKRYVRHFEEYIQGNWHWKNSGNHMPPIGSLQYVPDHYVHLKTVRAPICFEMSLQKLSEELRAGGLQRTKSGKVEKTAVPKKVYCVVDTKNQDFLKVTPESIVREDGSFDIDLTQDGGCRVHGDMRVRVFGLYSEDQRAPTIDEISTKIFVTKAGKEQGLCFFFWFHTYFVGNRGEPLMRLSLFDLDKAWKNKHWTFKPATIVELDLDKEVS